MLAMRHALARIPALAEAARQCRGGDAVEVARRLLGSGRAGGLDNDVLLAALRVGIVQDGDLERLLTAVRGVLLEAGPVSLIEARAWLPITVALAAQARNNEYAWVETAGETALVERLAVDVDRLADGDVVAAGTLLLKLMYRPLTADDGVSIGAIERIRPKTIRGLLRAWLEEAGELAGRTARMPTLLPLSDKTSAVMARHYSQSPYPRWDSVTLSPPGSLARALARFERAERLVFLDRAFDVLFAGAGTGQHVVQAAAGYGPGARVMAIDLSAPSLAWAEMMAARLAVPGVAFMVADLLDSDRLGRTFDIIECVGVLHHMADPFAGWRALLSVLKPHGLMYIGLYSATARRPIAAIAADPANPGPGCSDDEARRFRRLLLDRLADDPTARVAASRNFWTLNEFRDLALNPSERRLELGEIRRFLDEAGLEFLGFTLEPPVLARFHAAHPAAPWPGRLEDWAEFEAANPSTFDGMYRFWCARRGR
jgi:SAM-dependent methyltransferase